MTAQRVENYLKDQTGSDNPLVAEGFQNLMNLYVNKLWNQLSEESSRLVCNSEFVLAVNLSQFYEEFVRDFERRIEPLQLIELVTLIADNIFAKDRQRAFDFLNNFDNVVKQDKRAIVRLQTSKIQLRLKDKPTPGASKCKDLPLVRKTLEETKVLLNQLVDVGPVHAAYYCCSAEYQHQMGDHKLYYEEALHYLGCEDIEGKLSAEQKSQQAEKLSIAALLGDNVYNFGELLAHPILNVLSGSAKAWLNEILNAVNAGDWNGFLKHKAKLVAEYSEAGQKIDALEQKLRLQCLIEMAHRLPAQRRDLNFGDIARVVRVDEDTVELLVMKAVANNLIDAKIDEPSRVVNVSWVQPRVLSTEQIRALASRTGDWCANIGSLKEELQLNTRDLTV
ncbi:proteasome regulatory particle subunit [Globodera pallida]|uniref:26S proteasome non-ATPase regulatory subunit 13 n=1 Tax=Globodera pallida TaxID=36090 RepID=A0A183BYY6_GLOPA|nr:proteasome regulatory particle subunit [Globodera pallida]